MEITINIPFEEQYLQYALYGFLGLWCFITMCIARNIFKKNISDKEATTDGERAFLVVVMIPFLITSPIWVTLYFCILKPLGRLLLK